MGKRQNRRRGMAAAARKAGAAVQAPNPGRRALRLGKTLAKDSDVRAKARRAGIIAASTLGGPAGIAIATAATSPAVQARARKAAQKRKARRANR